MFLKRNLFIFILLLFFCFYTEAKDVCKEISSKEAEKIVADYKLKNKILTNVDPEVKLQKTNGECHYFYAEIYPDSVHSNRFYFIDMEHEVVDHSSRKRIALKENNCPAMSLNNVFFKEKVLSHYAIEGRKYDPEKSRMQKYKCMYVYYAVFDDGKKPLAIRYQINYKGKIIKWSYTNYFQFSFRVVCWGGNQISCVNPDECYQAAEIAVDNILINDLQPMKALITRIITIAR